MTSSSVPMLKESRRLALLRSACRQALGGTNRTTTVKICIPTSQHFTRISRRGIKGAMQRLRRSVPTQLCANTTEIEYQHGQYNFFPRAGLVVLTDARARSIKEGKKPVGFVGPTRKTLGASVTGYVCNFPTDLSTHHFCDASHVGSVEFPFFGLAMLPNTSLLLLSMLLCVAVSLMNSIEFPRREGVEFRRIWH